MEPVMSIYPQEKPYRNNATNRSRGFHTAPSGSKRSPFLYLVPTPPQVPQPPTFTRSFRGFSRFIPYVGLALTALELYNLYNNLEPRNAFDLGPWIHEGHCPNPLPPTGPDNVLSIQGGFPEQNSFHALTDGCLAGQAAGGTLWEDYIVPPFHNILVQLREHIPPPNERYQLVDSYWRRFDHFDEPVPVPRLRPVPVPIPWTDPYYWPDPFSYPPRVPQPNPNRVPVNPTKTQEVPRAPTERTVRGPKPSTRPRPRPRPQTRVRPRAREKERKQSVNKVIVIGKRILNFVTESVDFINAVYKALPRERKIYRASPQQKAFLIYLYAHELDYNLVLKYIVENQIEDFLYGKAGQAAAASAGHSFELGFNPRDIYIGFQAGPAL